MARARIDMTGERYGRLVVVSPLPTHGEKSPWLCRCDCGNEKVVERGNLRHGSVSSCGCLARELSSIRGKAKKWPAKPCSIAGCEEPSREYDRTLCRKHGQRKRRYGDPLYVTPDEVRRQRCREVALQVRPNPKPTTYKKLHSRHEHRVIGEQIAGRPLLSSEHVHHRDGDKHNNDPSNLEILTAAEHARLHAEERRRAHD